MVLLESTAPPVFLASPVSPTLAVSFPVVGAVSMDSLMITSA